MWHQPEGFLCGTNTSAFFVAPTQEVFFMCHMALAQVFFMCHMAPAQVTLRIDRVDISAQKFIAVNCGKLFYPNGFEKNFFSHFYVAKSEDTSSGS